MGPVPALGGALDADLPAVSQETGVPLDTLGAVLESMGFARMDPDEPMRDDELAVVPHRQPGRPGRRPRQRRPGPGQPARGRLGPTPWVRYVDAGGAPLKGFAHPTRLSQARRT